MIRSLCAVSLATLGLFALDLGTTAVAPVFGTPTLTEAAQASDYRGRIRRIRIRERNNGVNYNLVGVGTSDPLPTGGIADRGLQLMICADASCTDGVKLQIEQDQVTQVLRTGTFGFAGAMAPVGQSTFQTQLRDADGQPVGEPQLWTLIAGEDELVVEPVGAVSTELAAVTDLTMTSDACGNGKSRAVVEGPAATKVASMTYCTGFFDDAGQWRCEDDTLFHPDDPAYATARNQRARYASRGFSAELDALREGDPNTALPVYALSVDEDGQVDVLGQTTVQRGALGDAVLTSWEELIDEQLEQLQERPLFFGTVIGLNTTKKEPAESLDALLASDPVIDESVELLQENPLAAD
jgi:hypothetical protein